MLTDQAMCSSRLLCVGGTLEINRLLLVGFTIKIISARSMFWSTPSADIQYPISPTHLSFRAAQDFITVSDEEKLRLKFNITAQKSQLFGWVTWRISVRQLLLL